MRRTVALCALAALPLGVACGRDHGVALTTTTGAVIIPNEDAIQRLTAKRCQREAECDTVGAGKSYEDYPACERQISDELRSSLRRDACPYGVREDSADECAKQLRNRPCGAPSEVTLTSRLPACRVRQLCLE